jgi:4-amino-4-deoxy-L-arabinose transferase-like glycosyltransferase
MGFGLLLAPLKQGFELRMQLLTLGISTAALLVFLVLAARLFGKRLALLAGIAYILLPGPFLFDTWIKRDPMVTLFCLTAILAFFHKQDWLAGIFLGLGFLSKETSIFFAAGFIPLIMLCSRLHPPDHAAPSSRKKITCLPAYFHDSGTDSILVVPDLCQQFT